MDFGIPDVAFSICRPQVTRGAAEATARREAQEMGGVSSTPENMEARWTVEDFLRGEPWAVLYAPLSKAAFGVLCQMDRSSEDDFETGVLELQRGYAWELIATAALATRCFPHIVQRRIFAFAFTARAL